MMNPPGAEPALGRRAANPTTLMIWFNWDVRCACGCGVTGPGAWLSCPMSAARPIMRCIRVGVIHRRDNAALAVPRFHRSSTAELVSSARSSRCRRARRRGSRTLQEIYRETHVSAQQPSSFEEARLPPAHERPCRSQRHPFPSAQGSAQAERLIESIRYRWEFRLLRDAGRYRRSGPLGLRSATSDDVHGVRVGYAIGRTVGNAVVRNRIRRRLREVLRELDGHERLPSGRHLVIVSPAAASLSFDELRHHLRQLMLESDVTAGSVGA